MVLIEKQIKQYRALNEWFQSPLGHLVARSFTETLKAVTADIKGDTLLQIGSCHDNPWLNKMHFNHQWVATPTPVEAKQRLECALNHIPLPRNSLDCLLAPLSLEPFSNSLTLLDEMDRVLKPMGFIIILGINPWSLWGLASKCGLLPCYNDEEIKLRTPYHLNRTFLQRGYKHYSLTNFGYFFPSNQKLWRSQVSFFDEVGKMLWPFPSGFYCYVAQKYQYIPPSLIMKPLTQKVVPDLQPAI